MTFSMFSPTNKRASPLPQPSSAHADLQLITDKWGILLWTDLQASNEGNAAPRLDNNALQWRELGQKSVPTNQNVWVHLCSAELSLPHSFLQVFIKKTQVWTWRGGCSWNSSQRSFFFLSFSLALEKQPLANRHVQTNPTWTHRVSRCICVWHSLVILQEIQSPGTPNSKKADSEASAMLTYWNNCHTFKVSDWRGKGKHEV